MKPSFFSHQRLSITSMRGNAEARLLGAILDLVRREPELDEATIVARVGGLPGEASRLLRQLEADGHIDPVERPSASSDE